MVSEISRSTQPKFSKFETNNQSPEFRSNYRELASIQASKADKTTLSLISALLVTEQERNDRQSARIQELERDLAQLGDAYAYDGMVSIKLEAALDEGRRKDEKITRLQDAMAEYGLDYIDI